MAVRDAGMLDAHFGAGQKVVVVRHKHAPFAQSESELPIVRRLQQPTLLAGCHVDASPAQSVGHGRIDVLVEMKAKALHLFARLNLALELGWIEPAQLRDQLFAGLHLRVDLGAMIVIESKRRIDASQR